MTAPQQQTPGGRREDTALAVGAAVAAVMVAAQLGLVALLGAAVVKVLRHSNRRSVGRQLHAAATAQLTRALGEANTLIDQARERITRDTLDTLDTLTAVSGRTFGFPPGSLDVTSWPRLAGSVRAAARNALADLDDAFQRATRLLDGTPAGVLAAQKVLDDVAEHGLTALTDRAGRRWSLGAYTEMATRTAASRLAFAVQIASMTIAGLDLVMVDKTTLGESCPVCVPYEYRLLSVSGRTPVGTAVMVKDHTGQVVFGYVKASLADAVARGLFHNSCRHFPVPWADGVRMTVPLPSQRNTGPSYKAQQKQRALERVVRRQQRVHAVALTPLARVQARRRLVAARSNLDEHVRTYHSTRKAG